MLYEFHRTQNFKKPGSIHATYLLNGVPSIPRGSSTDGHQADGEVTHMQSSPYMSSSMAQEDIEEENISSRKVILAREEDLEGNQTM